MFCGTMIRDDTENIFLFGFLTMIKLIYHYYSSLVIKVVLIDLGCVCIDTYYIFLIGAKNKFVNERHTDFVGQSPKRYA